MKNIPLDVRLPTRLHLESEAAKNKEGPIRVRAHFPLVMTLAVPDYVHEALRRSGGRVIYPGYLSESSKVDRDTYSDPEERGLYQWTIGGEATLGLIGEEPALILEDPSLPFSLKPPIEVEGFFLQVFLASSVPGIVPAPGEEYGSVGVAESNPLEAYDRLQHSTTILDPFKLQVFLENRIGAEIVGHKVRMEEHIRDLFSLKISPEISSLTEGYIAAAEAFVRYVFFSGLDARHVLFTLSQESIDITRGWLTTKALNSIEDPFYRQVLIYTEAPGVITGARSEDGDIEGTLAIWNKYLLILNHPTLHFLAGNFRPIFGGILQFEPKETEAQPRPKHLPGIPVFKVPYNLGVDCHVTSKEDLKRPCRNLDAVPRPLVQYFAAKGNLEIGDGVWYVASGEFYDGSTGTVYFFVPEGFFAGTEQILQDLGLLKLGASSQVSVHNLLYELSRTYFAKVLSFARLNSASEAVSA